MAIGKAEIGGGIASGVADAIRLFGPGMIDRRQAEQQLQQQAAERDQAVTAFQAMQEGMNTGNADAVQQQATFLMSLSNPLYNKWGLAGYDWVREANKPQMQLPTQTRTTTRFALRPGSGFMGVSPQGATTATPGAQRFGETESFTSGRAQLSNSPFMPPTISGVPPSPKFALPSFNAGKPAGASQQVRVPSYNPQPMMQTTEETKPFGDWTDDEIWKLAQNDPAVFIRYKEAQQRQVNAAAQQEQNEWRRKNETANLAMKQQKLQIELDRLRQQASSPAEVNLIDYYRANKPQLESNNPDEWRPAMISFIDEYYRAYKRKPTVEELRSIIPNMNETQPQNKRLLMSLLRPLAAETMGNIGIIHQGNPDSLAHYGTSFINELMRNVNQESAPYAPAVGNPGQGGGQQQVQLTPEQLLVVDEMVAAYSEAELSGMAQRASAANDTSSSALFNAALQKKRQAGVR